MSQSSPRSVNSREPWLFASAMMGGLLVLMFFLYLPTITYLTGLWNQMQEGNYAHGYLVVMISAYLVYFNRHRLVQITPCPEYRAVLAVLAASLFWLMASVVYIEMLQTVGLLLLLVSIAWLVLGTPAIKILAFPLLFISFAIPIWFPLSPVLQEVTADVVFWLVRILEIPALRIENMIVLPAGRMSIEEACGGLNYFLAAMTLASFYAYLNYETLRSRLLVVIISAISAVLVNILRVFIVVYLGYTTDMKHPLVADHLTLGWYLFAGLVVVLLLADAQIHKVLKYRKIGASIAEPVTTQNKSCIKTNIHFFIIAIAAALSVSAGPAALFYLDNQGPRANQVALSSLQVKGWVASKDDDDWSPQYYGAQAQKVIYRNKSGQRVHFYMGFYPAQKQGEELINDMNRISDETLWRRQYQKAKQRSTNGRRVLEQRLEHKDGTRRLVWYWYHVAGQDTVNKYQAKALQVLGIVMGKPQASVIAIAARLDDEAGDTRALLDQFVKDIVVPVNTRVDGS